MSAALFTLYRVTNTATGHVYLGITSQTVEQRWSGFCSQARKNRGQLRLSADIRMYGEHSFTIETLRSAPDPWTLQYWADENGLLVQYGRNAGSHMPLKVRTKISAGNTGNKLPRRSETHRENHAKAMAEAVFTDERRKLISASSKKRGWSEEHRRKLSIAAKARANTPEYKARIAAINLGRKASPETRAKMSAAHTARAERERVSP